MILDSPAPQFNETQDRVANPHQPLKKNPGFGSLQVEVASVQATHAPTS
jgi:hypothetical protein